MNEVNLKNKKESFSLDIDEVLEFRYNIVNLKAMRVIIAYNKTTSEPSLTKVLFDATRMMLFSSFKNVINHTLPHLFYNR